MKQIKLTKGKFAIVDDSDFEWLNQWKWCISAYGYAVRTISKGKVIYMHRIINQTPERFDTDHINRNKLDNRRLNLRTVNRSQNEINKDLRIDNTSGYKGINLFRNGKWRVYITKASKTIHLGYFKNLELAVFARQNAERIYHQ